MIHKNISNRRRFSDIKSKRKMFILRHIKLWKDCQYPLHKLSKAKVHCSCPLCSSKTKRKFGVKNNSLSSWKVSDQKKLISANEAIKEYSQLDIEYDSFE